VGHGRPLHKEGHESERSVAGSPSAGVGGSVQGELEVWAEQILSLNTSVHRLEKEL
jgi:hypothetical protein